MVSKKTNKISPKDINLLLNKLVIIIKKFSNSYGNKKKRVSRKVGGAPGLFGFGNNTPKDKSLDEEIHSFLSNIFNNSQSILKNINMDYFKQKGIKNIFIKKNIDLLDKDNNFHNSENFQYNKRESSIIQFIKSNKDKIEPIISNIKRPWHIEKFDKEGRYIFLFKDESQPQLLHPDTGDIGYIIFKYNNSDINSAFKKVYPYYQYYILNKQIYDSINSNSNTDFDISSKDNIKKIREYIKEFQDIIAPLITPPNYDYKKLDTLITFYYYSKYITDDINTDNNDLIDLKILTKSQEKFGIYDKYILKHAVIYNIGVTLKLIQVILNSSDP
jgi:hypothetical protein